MERLSAQACREWAARIQWLAKEHAGRFYRQYDLGGLLIVISLVAILLASVGLLHAKSRLDSDRQALSRAVAAKGAGVAILESGDRANGLEAFDAYLSAYEDIPDVVQAMFKLADKEGLTLQRGEYKRDLDTHGKFVRYRMNLPLKGDSQAVYRYILSALHTHRSLALESIQFKRSRADASEIEVSIQWVLLARMPGSASEAEKTPLISMVSKS